MNFRLDMIALLAMLMLNQKQHDIAMVYVHHRNEETLPHFLNHAELHIMHAAITLSHTLNPKSFTTIVIPSADQ